MCRFSATLAPPPAPVDGLDTLLDDADDFNWFDAIDDLPEDVLGLPTNLQAGLQQQLAPAVPESDSSECPRPDAVGNSSGKSAGSTGCSDTSSYDLVEMFKQQVEQQAPAAPAPCQAPVQSFPQFVAASFAAVPQQQLMCGIAAPFAGACGMPPQLLAGALPATPAFLPAAALAGATGVLNNTVGIPTAAIKAETEFTAGGSAGVWRTGSTATAAAAATACGRRGSRANKTQEEIDAAVERIKQKRRESAQRSRARKNDYMHQLEIENQALKDEVQRLQQLLTAVQRNTFQQPAALVQLGTM